MSMFNHMSIAIFQPGVETSVGKHVSDSFQEGQVIKFGGTNKKKERLRLGSGEEVPSK